jgi:hypothetical protein
MTRAVLVVLVLAACPGSSKTPRVGDARTPTTDATGSTDAAGSGSGSTSNKATGTLLVRVEWKRAPTAVRASPGRNACNAARRPRARVHTLWGVADAIVIVEGQTASTAEPPVVTVADCMPSPPLSIAGAAFRIYNGESRRHELVVGAPIALDDLAKAPSTIPDDARRAALAWLGTEIDVAIDPSTAIGIATRDERADIAWVVSTPHRAAVTDDAGEALFPDLPPGKHAIRAWFPPAAGQPGKLARGEATVTAGGATTKVTLDLVAP